MNRAPVILLPRLLRPSAAAEYLGISVSTLSGLGIKPRKLGSRVVVYDRLDLDAFADDLRGAEASDAWGLA
jgi:predicted DNA-binding transcriptional regulator AlpA